MSSSNNDLPRSLSFLIEESISENARSLFKQFQSNTNPPNPPNRPDIGEDQDELIPTTEINEIDSSASARDKPLNVSDSIPGDGLRLRTIKGASNQVDSVNKEGEDDKILNANINKNKEQTNAAINSNEGVGKGKESVLSCFAEYKAEREVCSVNSYLN